MNTQTSVYQSGANSWEINELLLFSENVEPLWLQAQAIYKEMYRREKEGEKDLLYSVIGLWKHFCSHATSEYRKQVGKISLTLEQKIEFSNLWINDYPSYKIDNKLE